MHRYYGERRMQCRTRAFWSALTLFYVFTILCATYFGREPSVREVQGKIFWTVEKAVETGNWIYWYFIVGNILLFVPLGFILYYLFAGNWWLGILICLLFSCVIETLQYITATGLCELDDLVHNTLGGALGVWVAYGLRIFMRHRL